MDQTSSYKSSLLKFENQHAITLPGFIAHSFYSLVLFIFLVALLVSIFCNIILLIIEKMFKNPIYSAFIANLLAYRLIHWGFAPFNSYKLLLGIFISVTSILIFNYAIKKIYSTK